MNRSIVLIAVAALISIQFVHGDDEEGEFNLVQGNCSTALAKDMIYHEHIHKSYVPLVKRNATSSWYGDGTIYCLKALNENDESKGGTAFVKYGGVNHSYVTIEMHSKRGNKLEYDVQIYAR